MKHQQAPCADWPDDDLDERGKRTVRQRPTRSTRTRVSVAA